MKLTKYFMLACSALLLAACGNDDDFNTDGNVTVQMENATMNVKENAGLFYVPIKVTGKTNGPVRVTVDVAEVAASPAVEDKHYILTSKTVVIPDNETAVSLEFTATNDMEINDDRKFTITIVSAEGAKIGEPKSTEVTITDDDSLFYEALQGEWTFTDTNYFEGTAEAFKMKFVGVPEGDPEYEKTLYLQGFAGKSNLVAEVGYHYDEATNEITLEFELGQSLGQLNFSGLGVCDVALAGVDGEYLTVSGTVTATVSTDLRTITFNPEDVFYLAVFAGADFRGGYDGYAAMGMNR